MSVRCPDGHSSVSTDYCDVCGTPIEAGAPDTGSAATAAAGAPAEGGPTSCPHCGAPAPAAALFCENCGYDFTTGSLPVARASADPAVPAAAPVPAGPVPAGPVPAGPVPADPTAPSASSPPSSAAPSSAPSAAPSSPPSPAGPGPALGTPAPAGPDAWVAEVWVDPDWYDAQLPEDPMPSAGLPGLVPLRERSVLVGRPSASRGIRPQIDCGADSGVSRRHCQLNTDGQRWWVEDLQSANGTYVSRAGEALPTDPIPVGQRREVEDGDRIYLGAWTRIVIRKALPGEV